MYKYLYADLLISPTTFKINYTPRHQTPPPSASKRDLTKQNNDISPTRPPILIPSLILLPISRPPNPRLRPALPPPPALGLDNPNLPAPGRIHSTGKGSCRCRQYSSKRFRIVFLSPHLSVLFPRSEPAGGFLVPPPSTHFYTDLSKLIPAGALFLHVYNNSNDPPSSHRSRTAITPESLPHQCQ